MSDEFGAFKNREEEAWSLPIWTSLGAVAAPAKLLHAK